VTLDGNPWFIGTDACRALSMNLKDGTHQWLTGLRDDEKRLANRRDLPELFSGTFAPSLTLISESGLYKLVMRSNKPEARAFQDWVTRIVLPSIRRNGGYIAGQEKLATGEMSEAELMAKALLVANKVIEGQRKEIAVLDAEVNLVTVDEYFALTHRYATRATKCQLGARARY
jgi:prophage antirepressor-like protein